MTIDLKTLIADGEFFARVGPDPDGVDIPALVAGDRITATADVALNTVTVDNVLSTGLSGGDTLAGGTGSGEDLTLASTTHATRGDIKLRDEVVLLSEAKTHTSSDTKFSAIECTSTVTMNGTTSGNWLRFIELAPTISWDANPYSLNSHVFVNVEPAIVNAGGETRTMNIQGIFSSAPSYTGTTGVMTLTKHTCYSSTPKILGTVTATSMTGFYTGLTIGTGSTCTDYTGFEVQVLSNLGTLTATTGLKIPALGGTTPIGIEVAEPMVHTPKNVSSFGATTAIPIDRAVLRLTPTAEVTWGPSVDSPADGTNGQMLTLINSSAFNINLQNTTLDAESRFSFSSQSTNRFILLPSCAVTFVYSSTMDKWCQVGGSPSILAYDHGSLGSGTTIDPRKGDYQTCTTTTTHTLTTAYAGVAGDKLTLLITNDATTGRIITFGSGFQSTGTLTGTISKKAQITFRSNGTSWYEVSRSLAMT